MSGEHQHTFVAIGGSNRYRCSSCMVVGHLPATLFRQRKVSNQTIVPYVCQKQNARRERCHNEAVHVTGDRQSSRCAEHAPPTAVTKSA